ncbi:MAG: EamA family transporter [Nitrospirota bacterium]|nr:EamA family transporter [Nitrospirota bacterium]
MSPHLWGFTYVTMAMVVEAIGQLAFKQGAERAGAGLGLWGLFRGLWRNTAVVLGIACFAVEAVLWTMALRLLDVSLAFPAGSLCFVFVALLSRLWLQEQVGLERWIGVGLILGGVVLIGVS